MADQLTFESVLSAQGFLNGIRQMIAGLMNLKGQASTVTASINSGNMIEGLKKSLMGGDFSGLGKSMGGAITGGLTAGFGTLGGVAGAAASALGPVGIAALAAGAGILAVGSAIGTATGVASNFEHSISNVAAITGEAATTQFEYQGKLTTLAEVARQAGATSVYSASQAADAMANLASSGMNNQQIAAALPSTLNLAAAGNMDFARATEITSNSLAQFKLKAEDADRVTNVYAAVAAKSATSINDLGYAMTYVGPVAGAMGLSIEETSASLGVLANAGFKGSLGGTALRGALSDLMNPTKVTQETLAQFGLTMEDVDPRMHSMADIIDIFKENGMGASEMMKIFGERGGPGMLALLAAGGPAIRQMETDITGTSYAAEMAATQTKNLWGAQQQWASAVEEAQISVGNLIVPIQTLATQGFTSLLLGVTQGAQAFYGLVASSQAVSAIGGMFSSLGAAAQAAFSNLASIVSPAFEALGGGEAVMSALQTAFDALTAPLTLAATGISALAQGFTTLSGALSPVAQALGQNLATGIKQAQESFDRGKATVQAFIEVIGNTGPVQAFVSVLKGAADVAGKVWDGVKEAVPKALDGAFNAAKELIQRFLDWLGTTPLGKLLGMSEASATDVTEGAKNMLLAPFQGIINDIQTRANEIYDASHPVGEKAAEGVADGIEDNKDKVAESVGDAVGGDAALNAATEAGTTAGDAWVEAFGSAAEAGMYWNGSEWLSNSASRGGKEWAERAFEYMGQQFTYRQETSGNYATQQLYSGDTLLGSSSSAYTKDPLELFEAMTGLPAPEEGTAAYFNLLGDRISAKRAEMLEQISKPWELEGFDWSGVMENIEPIESMAGDRAATTSWLKDVLQMYVAQTEESGKEAAKSYAQAFAEGMANPNIADLGAMETIKNAIAAQQPWQAEDLEKQFASYKNALRSQIYDAKAFMETEFGNMADTAKQAFNGQLTSDERDMLLAMEPELQALKAWFPEEFAAAGGESILAMIEALKAGDLPGAMAAIAQDAADEVKTIFGGIGEAISSEMSEARSALQGNKIFEMLYGGTPEEKAQAEQWIADNVADTGKWYRSHFESAAKSWQGDAEQYGMKIPESFWSTLRSQWQEQGEWFDQDLAGRMQVLDAEIKQFYGSWEEFQNNASLENQIRALQYLQGDLDETTEKLKNQSVGYDNLKKTIEDCSDCAISEFAQWQEAQEGLFSGSYLGEGGSAYEQWKGAQIAAIRDVQNSMDRTGGVVVGKRYTGEEYDWADQYSREFKVTANTSEVDTALAKVNSDLDKLVADAREGADLNLNTDQAHSNLDTLISSILANSYQTIYVETVHYDTYAGSYDASGSSWDIDAAAADMSANLNSLTGYAEGTDYVPRDDIYKLHRGEAVLTEEENRNRGGNTILLKSENNFYGDVGDPEAWKDELDKRDNKLRREFNAADMKLAKA